MKVLQLNTSDVGGGAEAVALTLHRNLLERSIAAKLAVGWKRSRNHGISELGRSDTRFGLFKGLQRRFADSAGLQGVISLRSLASLDEAWDAIIIHNIHGGYLDLSAVGWLAQRGPVFLVMHDRWLLSGHCAHPLACERWRSGCGSCPLLEIPVAVPRDATRFNLWNKKRALLKIPFTLTSPARWLLELVKESYLSSKASKHVPNPVDTDTFFPGDQASARKLLGLSSDRPIIFLPIRNAWLNSLKDWPTFAASLRHIADLEPMVVTFGESRPPVDGKDLSLRTDMPSPLDMATLYRACDLVAYPTLAETAPVVLLEAGASGARVVTTDIAGCRELVDAGDLGSLAAPGDSEDFADKLREGLTAPHVIDQDRRRDFIAEHSTPSVVDQWLHLIKGARL